MYSTLIVILCLVLAHKSDASNLREMLLEDHASQQGRAMIVNLTRIPAWRGRLDVVHNLAYVAPAITTATCNTTTQNCAAIPGSSDTYPYCKVVPDSTNGQPLLQVTYPINSVNPSNAIPGGCEAYFYPYKNNPNSPFDPFSISGATLEYDLYVPADFQFQKGGKLPGMAGGGSQNGRGCSGGDVADTCFSYRMMWHRGGTLQGYLYLPRAIWDPSFCSLPRCSNNDVNVTYPCTVCDQSTGIVFYRGAANLTVGQWHNFRMVMRLNTPNVTDGYIAFYLNNNLVYSFDKMLWRQYPNVFIEGMMFSTFFGGNSADWASPQTQYLYFKNMKMYYDGPDDPLIGSRNERPRADDSNGQVWLQVPPEASMEL